MTDLLFLSSKITVDGDYSHETGRQLLLGRKTMTSLNSVLKIRDITLPTKVCIIKAKFFPVVTYGFESCTVKKGRMPKNWCLWTVVLENTPESPLDSREIKPVNLKRNQPWILVGRTDAEAIVLWSSGANSRLIGKVPDAGKHWGQKEKRVSENEMSAWHHQCNGCELGQISDDGEGQGGLVCCSPWGCKESDTTHDWTTTIGIKRCRF